MTSIPPISATAAYRRRARLLWGASLATLITAVGAQGAHAQMVGALMSAAHQAAAVARPVAASSASAALPTSASPAAMNAARLRAQGYQAAAAMAVDMAKAAQAAATKLHLNDPMGIPDGLAVGGLQPVANPLPASADSTGLSTWQGAAMPTASAANPNQVTVDQNSLRAVLSWTTFNVGQNTTLTFNQHGNANWVVLNRVVGGIDKTTGLRTSLDSALAPSKILGSIKADGTVLVLNQNGILFGPTSQVNVGSLIATSLEIGIDKNLASSGAVLSFATIAQRNAQFLNFGILGYGEQSPNLDPPAPTFSAQLSPTGGQDPMLAGSTVQVAAGASLTSADMGYLLLLAPKVDNAGLLSSADGEVALQSGTAALLTASTGTSGSADPDVRGLVVTSDSRGGIDPPVGTVTNEATGLIEAPRGYVSLGGGTVDVAGAVTATTSISENGYINIFGPTINVAPSAVIAVCPDPGCGDTASSATIPQDPTSLSLFKPSRVRIGAYTSSSDIAGPSGDLVTPLATTPATIDIGAHSLIYVPGGNISVGAEPTPATTGAGAASQIVVESGAVIDAAGLVDVLVPASRNSIAIDPVKGNELANSPAFRNGFLNGAKVFLDPRLSGVTADGVAWVGSPLISAVAFAQQVGVTVSELMIKGGNVTLGAQTATTLGGLSPAKAPPFSIANGAVIDIEGGWRTFQAGPVQQSYLVDTNGQVIPISQANPDDIYVAVYQGYTVSQPRWGISRSYVDPLLTGTRLEGQYTEGQDAGSLTLSGSVVGIDANASIFAGAYAGVEQILGATPGVVSSKPAVYGDVRRLQAAPSELPAGGYLDVDLALGSGGGDISLDGAQSFAKQTYTPRASDTTHLDAGALSAAGLSQLTLQTTGAITVQGDAALTLAAGGAFEATADRTITLVAGSSITAPAGSIDIKTVATDTLSPGSALVSEPAHGASADAPGSFDIVVDGTLDVAGRWVNDFNMPAGTLAGSAYLSGGEITLNAAPTITTTPLNTSGPANTDISGSILVDASARLDLSGGGYVNNLGNLTTTATGGNLSLIENTNFYRPDGDSSGFRVNGVVDVNSNPVVPNNPSAITSVISIAGTILDAGFAGGGSFTLTTPAFTFAANGASAVSQAGCLAGGICGAALPVSFFSTAGFANYKITSFGTSFLANDFSNGLQGYNAVLTTQVAEVTAAQPLSLAQSYFNPVETNVAFNALRRLPTGRSVYDVLQPSVPGAWDQKPVSLTLDGLLELKVDAGAQVTGSAQSSLTVNLLDNQGTITLPGGSLTQVQNTLTGAGIAVRSLADVFGAAPYAEGGLNLLGLQLGGALITNAQAAANGSGSTLIYLTADPDLMPQPGDTRGVFLGAASDTNLSGVAIVNPRALPKGNLSIPGFQDGKVIGGGSFVADGGTVKIRLFDAEPGARIDLTGAYAAFDRPTIPFAPPTGDPAASYASTPVWSNGGALTLNQGGTIAGAVVDARGDVTGLAPLALGGTLTASNAVLYATGNPVPSLDYIAGKTPLAVSDITNAGFASLVVEGGLNSQGPASLTLAGDLIIESAPVLAGGTPSAPTIGAEGALSIKAAYISLSSQAQAIGGDAVGAIGSGQITFTADAIDVTGAVLFDRSVSQATLSATGDIRLIGSPPPAGSGALNASLNGQLAANGDLVLNSAQVYPTTGTTFVLGTTGVSSPGGPANGAITFNAVGATPATPYSAGGVLSVAAANIDQNGVVRAPLGHLTLGSDTGITDANKDFHIAAGQTTLTLEKGSITSVSADGLDIPYGTTTDQVEWFFTPTQAQALTAPPDGLLRLAAGSIDTRTGASVDLKGGGDVYAYEFVAGKGGSRDVLDAFNPDQFTSTNGFQYPDKRQVYAIVPGLSSAAVAALDPIYSANYQSGAPSLYGAGAGMSVFLNAAPGLAAGWYTLLPAQYALLPGGMRVVQDTAAATPPVDAHGHATGTVVSSGVGANKVNTIVTAGYYGIAGVDTRSATPVVFDVQSQKTILQESNIALTQGATYFSALATHAGVPVPQLPIDAGRLVLSPVNSLSLDASFDTTPVDLPKTSAFPAIVGRGSEVDVSATTLVIDHIDPAVPTSGVTTITDTSLANLNAASLYVGGIRTDNADGSTSLDATATTITVQSGATLSAPEILFTADGPGSRITVSNGATILATGPVTGESSSPYVIDGLAPDPALAGHFLRIQTGKAAFLRVSDGPERLLTRLDIKDGGAPGTIVIGAPLLAGAPALIKGVSVEANTPGIFKLDTSVQIMATNVALGAQTITLGPQGSGLLLTPQLLASLGQSASVTLQSATPITFAAGAYAFDGLTLDTPGLTAANDGAVVLNALGSVSIADSSPATTSCLAGGACGTGSFAISANSIAFGSGTIEMYGAGSLVTLSAAKGVFADGATIFDAGPAALTIDAPFVGDRGAQAADSPTPSLALTTTGAVSIASATPASTFTAPAGTPGSSLLVTGSSVSITGAELRATAGKLDIQSASGIAVAGGALLATPSYAKTFGDAADPTTVSAPGGQLTLAALAGDIAISDDSTLAVGGAQGQAGTLSLSARGPSNSVYAYHSATTDRVSLASVFSAAAPGGGASLTLDTGEGFDLSAFAAGAGKDFTGAISVRAGSGELTLADGDRLRATSVSLTADGGPVVISGTIDTSGVNGGAVGLYGGSTGVADTFAGVELTKTAVIDTHATGYGATSTLQAHGGDVTLGVDEIGPTITDPTGAVIATQSGAIQIDAGARIDVSATNTANRLVNMNRSNGTDYTYVPGDVGGAVTFRAPVITQSGGGETVNITVQGAIAGADSIVLDAFRRFDLKTMAMNNGYVGVSVADNTATLDLRPTGSGKINPLADENGPLVQFVQGFATAVAVPTGVSSLANFHARPEIELDYAGDIVLASNWNLGAGVVNTGAAVAAGLMAADTALPGQLMVAPGAEAALLSQTYFDPVSQQQRPITEALYRVGGSYYGEPGVLSVRGQGNLTLNGSITDGFFQFADQTDPGYLNQVLGGGNSLYQASVDPTCVGGCAGLPTFTTKGGQPPDFISIKLTGGFNVLPDANGNSTAMLIPPDAPYSSAANSAAALGDPQTGALVSGSGDPLGSAQLFPLLTTGSGGTTAVGSWSYRLVAGADLGAGSSPLPSVNPLTLAGGAANLTVQGQNVYGYKAVAGTPAYTDSLNLYANGQSLPASQWYQAFVTSAGLACDICTTYTSINFSGASDSAKSAIKGLAQTFFASYPTTDYKITGTSRIDTTLYDASLFMVYLSNHFSQLSSDFKTPPASNVTTPAVYAVAPTLVRTGTGDISVAASGNIDLSNGGPQTLTKTGQIVATDNKEMQLGGAAIYTAGAIAELGTAFVPGPDNTSIQVNLGVTALSSNNLGTPYGYGLKNNGFAGVLVADPAYTQGGGSITLDAGGDVLGRRDVYEEARLAGFGRSVSALPSWVGTGDQPWRTGVIGAASANLQIDPQLFQEGLAALGGGNIVVRAGGNVSDLSLVAGDSVTTASVGPMNTAVGQSPALFNLSEGDISVIAGGDILGGRLDVAAGNATLTATGNVAKAGQVYSGIDAGVIDNALRVRVSDGVVTVEAGGAASVESIGALGLNDNTSGLNSQGFFANGAGVNILAGGAVDVANNGHEDGLAPNNATGVVYPGSFEAVSFTGDLTIGSATAPVLLYPDPSGTLTLLTAGNIAPTIIAQLDADQTLLPGVFSSVTFVNSAFAGGLNFQFPSVLPNTNDIILREYHNPNSTHANDTVPNRIAAGGDVGAIPGGDMRGLVLSTAKQTRIAAGQDIVNLVFLGQNVAPTDVSRITAHRDITATTVLDFQSGNAKNKLPTVQGNTFVLGGPGALFVEAGRDAGPFLNSAVSNGQTYGGGIITVGNQWNPWLPAQSADIYTEFGVAGGQEFSNLISTYLNPTNFSNLPDYEFLQTTDANGVRAVDRTQEIYQLSLVDWMKSIAADVINRYDTAQHVSAPPANAPALIQVMETLQSGGTTSFSQALSVLPQLSGQRMPLIPWLLLNAPSTLPGGGKTDITYAEAMTAFSTLPTLNQREFLIKDVYFNELIETSVPGSPSYLKYSRGYTAVNTLFPASDNYTANSLNGGLAPGLTPVQTGNLDLRLATIQTDQGGDIAILGPGGRVLAGSVVSTAVQPSRRFYDGAQLYAAIYPIPGAAGTITAIPPGYEGVLTLRGGSIDSFTDGDFLLNQSRAFTEEGGDVALWSSNADVNAGQGPRTTADVAPAVVHIDADAFSQVSTNAAVSGAGIGAFSADTSGLAPNVFLMAPRGTVDAGDAGVRSAGNVFIAAFQVANADAIQAQGTISGAGGPAAVNVGAQSSGEAASAAAAQAAQAATGSRGDQIQRPLIIVDVLGFLPDESGLCTEDDKRKGKCE